MSKLIITLDSTQLKEFMTCEQSWCLRYVEDLRSFHETRIYLDKGSFVHKLLEVFYVLRTMNPNEDKFKTQRTVINLFKSGKLMKESGLDKETEKLICERFLQYVMKWMAHDFTPLKRNGVPGVEIGFSRVLHESEDHLYVVEGKIDLLSKTPNYEDCFVDNKTQERIKNLYPFKPQFLTYAWATGFKWGIINYFRLQKEYSEKDTFRRQLIYFEDWQIEKWKSKMLGIFKRIEDVMRINEVENQNDLKAGMFRQNLGSCAGVYESQPCYFTQICENPGREQLTKLVYFNKTKKWSPWSTESTEIEVTQ